MSNALKNGLEPVRRASVTDKDLDDIHRQFVVMPFLPGTTHDDHRRKVAAIDMKRTGHEPCFKGNPCID
ncbi:MAG: hypothetical protein KDJ67_07020 [Nitratireductor sp.]|nr:hypothetical protein [Nitratireductor sp.]